MNNIENRQQLQDQIPDNFKIRMINLPGMHFFYYYPEQNLIALTDSKNFQVLFYSINGNEIEQMGEVSQYFNRNFEKKFSIIIYLQNMILMDFKDHVVKIDTNNFNATQIFLDVYLPKVYYLSQQVNRNSFFVHKQLIKRLTIYSLRNMKISHTIFIKRYIFSTQFYKYIVQAYSQYHLYYYNIKMTKRIRKLRINLVQEPIFNSNYIILPFKDKNNYQVQVIHFEIYNICSMKKEKILYLNKSQPDTLVSCMFIQHFQVIAILYQDKLDFYDFDTLELIGWKKLENGFVRFIKYDNKHGFSIFQARIEAIKQY